MGRRPSAISDKKPARELALFLRNLRCTVGNPTYRELGKLAKYSHNALSQTADGRYVRWMRVEEFINALERYCELKRIGAITDADRERARQLHAEATEINRQTKAAAAANNRLLWRQTDRKLREPGERAARTRAPGRWNITSRGDVRTLNRVGTRAELAVLLYELMDMADLPDDILSTVATPDWRANLSKLGRLTVEDVRSVILIAGGTKGDGLAWGAAWKRTEPEAPVPAQRPPAPAENIGPNHEFPPWGPPTMNLASPTAPGLWVLRPTKRRQGNSEPKDRTR
jgi:hypothetical protein